MVNLLNKIKFFFLFTIFFLIHFLSINSAKTYADIVKSIHGFTYEISGMNYTVVNNLNIHQMMKNSSNDKIKNYLKNYEMILLMAKTEFLIHTSLLGDNIGLFSVPSTEATDIVVNEKYVDYACARKLEDLENSSKTKVKGYSCKTYPYPKESSWSVYYTYRNPMTNLDADTSSVAFANPLNKNNYFVATITCDPTRCKKLQNDFLKLVQSIRFN